MTVHTAHTVHTITPFYCHKIYVYRPRGLLPSAFVSKILYTFPISSMCATYPAYLILIFREYEVYS